MYKVIFKHPEQAYIYQKLLDAVNKLCEDYKKNCTCVAGYRSLECQKATNAQVLATRKGAYQTSDGAVYTGTGADRKCWAAVYGKSNHCFCIAMDIDDEWFKALTNEQLKKFDLIKSMSYEPWHVQLIEHQGISQEKKIEIRDSVLKGKGDNVNTVEIPEVDELAEAIDFLVVKAGISKDWYKTIKDLAAKKEYQFIDDFVIKIWKAWKEGK